MRHQLRFVMNFELKNEYDKTIKNSLPLYLYSEYKNSENPKLK